MEVPWVADHSWLSFCEIGRYPVSIRCKCNGSCDILIRPSDPVLHSFWFML